MTGDVPDRPPRPPAATVALAMADAVRDWPRRGPRLAGLAVFVAIAWFALFAGQCVVAAALEPLTSLLLGERAGEISWLAFPLAYAAAAAAALPVNCGTLLELHRSNLTLARGEALPDMETHPWLPRAVRSGGKARLLACAAVLGAVAVGMGISGAIAVHELAGGVAWNSTAYLAREWAKAVALALPAGICWVLFWPLPYVVVTRPDRTLLRPLAECVRLLIAAPGGFLAAGLASGAALAAGVLPWGLGLPVFGPLSGLLTAHAYRHLTGDEPGGGAGEGTVKEGAAAA